MRRDRGRHWRRLVGRGESRRLLSGTRIAGRHSDADHGDVLVHGGRRSGVVLIWHVSGLMRHAAILVLGRHAVVLLGRIWHVVGIHGVHVLVLVLMLMLVMLMLGLMVILWDVGRGLPPARASQTTRHVDTRHTTNSSLYVLPSRQMAVTHRAGLGVE